MSNPLQKYFRQPKIYVALPSRGIYFNQGSFDGDPTNMPVYGMTGMDEIIMQTPDALLNGECTVKVIESCCPYIKNAWEVASIDLDLVLASIRIATFGHNLDVGHKCPKCETEHEYTVNVSQIVDHYSAFSFNNTVKVGGLTVRLKPLSYRQTTDFGIRNFELQQKLSQLTSADQYKDLIAEIFVELGKIQQEVHIASIDTVSTDSEVVSNRDDIAEWVANLDRELLAIIKNAIKDNRDRMIPPAQTVQCDECQEISKINIELDQSSFFGRA